MKTFFILPVWFIATLVTPFLPAYHPWYRKYRTPVDWSYRATPVAVLLGIIIWWQFFLVIMLATKLLLLPVKNIGPDADWNVPAKSWSSAWWKRGPDGKLHQFYFGDDGKIYDSGKLLQ